MLSHNGEGICRLATLNGYIGTCENRWGREAVVLESWREAAVAGGSGLLLVCLVSGRSNTIVECGCCVSFGGGLGYCTGIGDARGGPISEQREGLGADQIWHSCRIPSPRPNRSASFGTSRRLQS